MIETVRKERRLLKKLIKQSKKYPEQKVPISKLKIDFSDYYVRQLVSKKLICIASIENRQNDNTGDYYYDSLLVLEAGLHYDEGRYENFKKFCVRSIFTPIVVSVITTGIMWAIGLLSGLAHL